MLTIAVWRARSRSSDTTQLHVDRQDDPLARIRAKGRPRSIVAALRERGYDTLYVDGGRTIQGFLKADLIDELIITTVPILLGDGVPLFGTIGRSPAFKHVSTRR